MRKERRSHNDRNEGTKRDGFRRSDPRLYTLICPDVPFRSLPTGTIGTTRRVTQRLGVWDQVPIAESAQTPTVENGEDDWREQVV